MTTKLACADFAFPLLSHDHALDLIAMLDIPGVDIGLFEDRSHLWPSREFSNLRGAARQLRQKLDDRGLVAADVFMQMGEDFSACAANHPQATRRQQARDWFSKTLEYTAECGGQHVTSLPGVLFAEEAPDASWGRAVEELAWRVGQAAAHDIAYGIEAHIGSLAPRPQAAAQLIADVPGLTLTLDYTHFTKIGLPDTEIEPLLSYASHFHVRGGCEGRLQERFTRNTIDYQRVVEVMRASGYDGWLGIEYVWIDWEHCNECDNVSETILFRDFFRSLP